MCRDQRVIKHYEPTHDNYYGDTYATYYIAKLQRIHCSDAMECKNKDYSLTSILSVSTLLTR